MIETDDPNKIEVHRIHSQYGNKVTLLSCDHLPSRMPIMSPWETISDEISNNSLTMVEYFLPELQRRVFNYPFPPLRNLAKNYADQYGINEFYGRVISVAAEYDKQVAVADNANCMAFEYYYRIPQFTWALSVQPAFSNVYDLLNHRTSEINWISMALGLVGLAYFIGPFYLMGFYEQQQRQTYERFIPDIVDSRRLITARGIEQENTDVLYIGPHAHINRIKWYLENPDDVPSKVKGKLYSLIPGLPRSTRIYQYVEELHYWENTANHPIKL